MSLKKDGKGVIRLGDSTSHGGKVIAVAHVRNEILKKSEGKMELLYNN